MFKKSLLTLALLLSFVQIGSATHLLGGEITWRCDNFGRFTFKVTLFTDCPVIDPAFTIPLNTPAGVLTLPLDSMDTEAATCSNAPRPCKDGYNTYIFTSDPVFLSGTPPAQGWSINYSTCCRGDHQNGTDGTFYLESKIYPFTPAGSTVPQSVNSCYDQSPVFADPPSPQQFTNSTKSLYFRAHDRNQDSLYYRLESPLNAANTPITWNAGFSADQPFPNSSTDPANQDLVMDTASGMLTVTLGANAQTGVYPTLMVVESWRYGDTSLGPQLIAEVKREMPLVVIQNSNGFYCNNNSNVSNAAPHAMVDTSMYPAVQFDGTTYTANVYAGDTVSFNIQALDQDQKADCSFQTINFSGGGAQARNVVNDSIMPCRGIHPCAKFTPASGQTGFSSTINNAINFQWATGTQHIYNQHGISRYFFAASFEDDFCPINAKTLVPIVVNVIDSTSAGSGVGLEQPKLAGQLEIHPNPVKDNFTIDLAPNQRGGNAIIEIWDAAGRLVSSSEVTANSTELVVESPKAAGVYSVVLKLDEQVFFSQIVK